MLLCNKKSKFEISSSYRTVRRLIYFFIYFFIGCLARKIKQAPKKGSKVSFFKDNRQQQQIRVDKCFFFKSSFKILKYLFTNLKSFTNAQYVLFPYSYCYDRKL